MNGDVYYADTGTELSAVPQYKYLLAETFSHMKIPKGIFVSKKAKELKPLLFMSAHISGKDMKIKKSWNLHSV